jgi:hypothetical protein
MSFIGRWRRHLFGTEEENPHIGTLLSLHEHPEVRGEEDSRWNSFAGQIQKAVAGLDDDFFQDLADAARELKAGRSSRAEAIFYAKLLVDDALKEGQSRTEIFKGDIRREIEEIWANQFSANEDGPSAKDKKRAKQKSNSVRWPDVYKAAGIEDAARKPKGRENIG